MKIIDAHVHLVQCIAGTGARGEMRACGGGKGCYPDGTVFSLIPSFLGETDVTPEKVLKLMDEQQVEKAVLLQGNFIGFQNLYSLEAMKKWPERFLTAAAYDPWSFERDALVEALFEKLGFKVVKFELSTGAGTMCNHPVFDLDGDVMEREYAYADDHDLIFVADIGKWGSPSCQVEALRRAILRHPRMKFMICHLLAPNQAAEAELPAALERLNLPNVWFDLAALQHNLKPDAAPYPVTRRFLKRAAETVGAEKLIFGSDLPSVLCNHRYEDLVATVADHPAFSPEQKELILYGNAEKVFFEG